MGHVLGLATAWACVLAAFVFGLSFWGPMFIGGPGAHQAPLGAFIYAPAAFFLTFVIVYLIQIRRALRLSRGGKFAYFIVLALFLIFVAHVVNNFTGMGLIELVSSIDFKGYSQSERLKRIPPLTQDEHHLLQSTHFNIQVGVVSPTFPPAYTRSLIKDLKKTGLFDEVAEFAQMDKIDMIATVKGAIYGDKTGQRFAMRPSDGPGKEVLITRDYTIGGLLSQSEERKQYLDRLSIDIITTVPTLLNRDQHEGKWRDGKYTGRGTFVWANGDRYEGDFVNGKRTGQGILVRAKGTRYEGAFVNGERTGQGALIWTNGTRYEGDFVKGKRTGRGVTLRSNGTRYEGDVLNGRRHGHGTLVWASGTRYEGDWVDGKRSGQGVLTWASGARYEGAWENDNPHGFGTKTGASGTTFTGTWTNGCFRDGDQTTMIGTTASRCRFK